MKAHRSLDSLWHQQWLCMVTRARTQISVPAWHWVPWASMGSFWLVFPEVDCGVAQREHVLSLGSCVLVLLWGSATRQGQPCFALCHWADGSAQGSLRSHGHISLAPCYLPMPCAVYDSGKYLPRVNVCPPILPGLVVKGRHHTWLYFEICCLSAEYTGRHSWILWGGWNVCCSDPLSHALPALLA